MSFVIELAYFSVLAYTSHYQWCNSFQDKNLSGNLAIFSYFSQRFVSLGPHKVFCYLTISYNNFFVCFSSGSRDRVGEADCAQRKVCRYSHRWRRNPSRNIDGFFLITQKWSQTKPIKKYRNPEMTWMYQTVPTNNIGTAVPVPTQHSCVNR